MCNLNLKLFLSPSEEPNSYKLGAFIPVFNLSVSLHVFTITVRVHVGTFDIEVQVHILILFFNRECRYNTCKGTNMN